MEARKAAWNSDYFSDLELKNRRFKRLAIAAALLFLGVLGVLVAQIINAIK